MRWLRSLVALACSCVALPADAQSDRVNALIAEGDHLASEAVRQTEVAILKYREADRLAASSPDIRLRATARLKVVQGLYLTDALTQCLAVAPEVESMARSIDAKDLLGNLYRATGACNLGLGLFEEADHAFDLASQLLAVHGTSTQYALALNNRAANARIQGQLGEAIGYGQQAMGVLERALAAGEDLTPRVQFAVPFNLGKAMADSGDFVGARPFLERSFRVAERYNDIGGQMHALVDTGEWYETQGDLDRAERYYRRAVDYTRRYQNGKELEAQALSALGRLALSRSEFALAAQFLTEAFSVFRDAQLQSRFATNLVDLARAKAALGDHAGAAADLDRAIALSRERKQSVSTVLALIERGRQRTAARSFDTARADFENAVAVANESRLVPLLPAAIAGRARVAELSGDLVRAAAIYEEAAAAVDRIRGHIVSIEMRTSFAASTHDVYSGLIRVLDSLHRQFPSEGYDRRALMTLERERSQSLDLDISLARRLSSPGTAGPEARIARIQSALFAPDLSEARRQQLQAELDDAERNLQLTSPALPPQAAAERRARSLVDLQASLADGEVLLEYAVDESRSLVFVITRSSFTLVRLTIGGGLTDRVAFFVRALENDVREAAVSSGRVLAKELIEPLHLDRAARLLIVATGPLARLPFGALPLINAGRAEPLLLHHNISYLPSLTLFEQRRSSRLGPIERRVLAVADAQPPAGDMRRLRALPASRVEAMAVARHAQSTLLVGKDATETAIKSQATSGYSMWHLATHAILDEAVPERSAVVLADSDHEDGLLQAREIYQLPLHGALVVLSGCRTADGQVSGAEGLHSLSRAFLQAGGRAVVGALWEVPDSGTAELVLTFYRALERGYDAGAALSQAQRAVMGHDPYANSRTWAALVLLGDPAVAMAAPPPSSAMNAAMLTLVGMIGLLAVTTVKRKLGSS